MLRVAAAAARRPLHALALGGLLVTVLAFLGMGLEGRLHRGDLVISDTGSDTAGKLAAERFGESSDLIVVLEGPQRSLRRQGARLERAFERRAGVEVLAPWEAGNRPPLRPSADRALLLVRAERPAEEVSTTIAPALRRDVERVVRAPVEAHLSGYPDVADGIHEGTLEAIKRAEMLAAPLLVLILLLVFRSPIAALLPLGVGFTAIGAGTGVLELVNRFADLDAVALNLMSMMGLALGVDYALLMVSRFREELALDRPVDEAVLTAVQTSGRTVAFAGAAVAAAMVGALAVTPGGLLVSATFGVLVAVVMSVLVALVALPACLKLLGRRIDRWSFGRPAGESRLAAGALRALRRPLVAGGLVLGLLLAASSPALGLDPGPPDPRILPPGNEHREDFDAVNAAVGPGWTAPFVVTVASRNGPITRADRLKAIGRWQRRIARNPDVVAVLGPGEIERRAAPLGRIPGQLADARRGVDRGLRAQSRLQGGLDRAGDGVVAVRTGLSDAARGAARLERGGDDATEGARQVSAGVSRARAGARRLRGGLADARRGARSLAAGGRRLEAGARRIADGVAKAREGAERGRPDVARLAERLREGAADLDRLAEPARISQRELEQAIAGLNAMLPTSKADPRYRAVYTSIAKASAALSGRNPVDGARVADGYDGLPQALSEAGAGAREAADGVVKLQAELDRLSRGLRRLDGGATELERGARRVDDGADRLVSGLSRLGEGAGSLTGGLAELERGVAPLADGIRRLGDGARGLRTGLSRGAASTGRLEDGLRSMEAGTGAERARTKELGSGLAGARRLGDVVQSGHFVLAAIDASRPADRRRSRFAVNVDRGGSAAQVVVIGRGFVGRGEHPLRAALEREVPRLERTAHAEATVGGPGATLQDFETVVFGKLWLVILVLAGVTYVVLVGVLRSLLAPLIAVVLNMLTVAAAFGVLVLLFQGATPLGGPGYLDTVMVSAIVSIVFGLSIDYEVFLLARMREGYLLTGDPVRAIEHGLRRTAAVVTGAALIMTGVFVAFGLGDIVTMKQLGIGLTVAVLLDATLVRLVLLPAVLRAAGHAAWWLPGPLERALDGLSQGPRRPLVLPTSGDPRPN